MMESGQKRKHESDDDELTAGQCQQRCEEFVSVTGTDEALAQYYLQDVDWNIERALNLYFESLSDPLDNLGTTTAAAATSTTVTTTSAVATSTAVTTTSATSTLTTLMASSEASTSSSSSATASAAGKVTGDEVQELSDRYIKLISWNIDGLDRNNILNRTRAVVGVIETEKPDIIFLQEVINETFSYIEKKCEEYDCVAGGKDNYFTMLMFKKRRVVMRDYFTVPFESSVMMRNLLTAQITVDKRVKLHVCTSHLESTKDHAKERMKQLMTCFKHMQEADGDNTVIFGGDLNLRDKEIMKLPPGVVDLWEACGSKPDLRYTWDTLRNTNKSCSFSARLRFDRLYLRQDKPTPATIKPVHFGLRGLEKVAGCQSFPSDHWALLAVFEITAL